MKATPLKRRRRVFSEDGPDPIDVYVGKRVRVSREKAGLSQPSSAAFTTNTSGSHKR
jgi:hypothetical protein